MTSADRGTEDHGNYLVLEWIVNCAAGKQRVRRVETASPRGRSLTAVCAASVSFGCQRRFREFIELRDCGACDTEDLATAAAECDPGFECGNTLGAQALEQRQRQFGW